METKGNYTVKRAVRIPQLRLEGGSQYAVKSMELMREEPTKGVNASGTVTLMRVTNLETGELSNILLGTVLKQLFSDEDVYVGRCYLIEVGDIAGDNQWRDYFLYEIEDPSGAGSVA